MIKIDNKIKNIYYMLCYVFNGNSLKEIREERLGEEAFENIYDLFSILLCLILKKQLKKGIYKNYELFESELNTVKGKIKINESILNNSLLKKKITCSHDEFTENTMLNKIIKTTIYYLFRSNKINNEIKKELKKISYYFYNVEILDINTINWNLIKYSKSTTYYRNCIYLCKLLLTGMIVSDEKGKIYFREFLDDKRVSSIYENFLKAYFKKKYPFFYVSSKIYRLNNSKYRSNFLPIMKTDLTLEYENRKLIIDAKYYSRILSESQYGSKVISSGNIFQILAYVDNQDPLKNGDVVGMLLYAQTVEEKIDIHEEMNNHLIVIQTLDLNAEWNTIEEQLNKIADNFIKNNF